ncbi:hypothetical protein OG2516_03725 [Oceanicola granulosus HTCC2516]|uniref:BioF2-like acetyltransferase domain-containing protein n=2 Tax=Oceanicola granulosus TaxID=252302 RepID=Q2CG66_OCEGH|nr:hypothetical protein OG2516_03725 [Oceanicola granulosus HTCC2516]
MEALQQTPVFAAAVRALGGRARVVGGALVIERRLLGVPVRLASRWRAGEGSAPAALVNAETAACGAPLRAMGYRRIVAPVEVAELCLAPPPDALRAAMAQKWRNRLNAGLARAGPAPEGGPFCMERHGWVLAAEAAQRRARGYRGLPGALVPALAAAEPGAVHCAAIGRQAAMIFVRHGAVATYLVGWCGDEGRAAEAHRRLLWAAMLSLRAQGVCRLDLGTTNAAAPGLRRFKAGSGARLRRLGGTWLWLPGCRACGIGSARSGR